MPSDRASSKEYLLPLILLGILLIFVVYPTLSVLIKSFSVDGKPGFGSYISVFSERRFYSAVWGSLLVASGVSVCSTLLGLILSLTVFRTRLPLRRLFAFCAVLPMIIPGFVSTLSYIFLFGRNGLITYKLLGLSWDIYSWKSVLIIQTLDFSAISFLMISAVLAGVDGRVEEAARSLGSSELEVLFTVTLPLIRPGLIGALLLTFLRSIADFGTPLILGGRFDTLASASYTQLIGTYNMEMAATLNSVLLVFCLIVFLLFARTQRVATRVRTAAPEEGRKVLALPGPIQAQMWIIGFLFCLFVLSLLLSVFLAAFTRHLGGSYALTLEHFRILPQRGWNSTLNTLVFATVTSVLMSLLGLITAYLVTRFRFKGRGVLDLLATVPFAIPGTLMGVGFALAFSRPPLLLAGGWAIVIAVTVIRELPLGLRAGVSVLSQQDRAIEEASESLGAARITTFFTVVVPLARPALVASALYAFVSTVQTVGAIIFVINPRNKVLSVDVFEAIYRSDIGDAAALSMFMIVLAALGVGTIFLLSRRRGVPSWMRRAVLR
jgi:iron(III) transport system permease protein